eukprot:5427993-Pleurochrysis_carterae.AAC.1
MIRQKSVIVLRRLHRALRRQEPTERGEYTDTGKTKGWKWESAKWMLLNQSNCTSDQDRWTRKQCGLPLPKQELHHAVSLRRKALHSIVVAAPQKVPIGPTARAR